MSILKKYIDKLQSQKYLQKDRNSITVDDVTIDFPLVFEGNGKMYFFKLDRYVYLKGTRYTKADGIRTMDRPRYQEGQRRLQLRTVYSRRSLHVQGHHHRRRPHS